MGPDGDTETEITAELVRDLLRDQHPDLADQPLTFGARGWDNQIWRLGSDLAVRLPWATSTADALLRAGCRHSGRLPDGPASARSGWGTRRPDQQGRAAGRRGEGLRPLPHRGH